MDGNFRKRLQRRLYYGDSACMEATSLPMTELSVEYFKDAVSQKLGHVELDTASDLIRRNHVSPCSMVLSMMYAKRLKDKNQDYLYAMSSSDVFFISMMMASKYMYDEGVDEEVFNDEWADSLDQDTEDVNQMEMDFLKAIDWHLFVRPEEFEDALAAIEKRLALQEGLKRGWFTYSEMAALTDVNLMASLWRHIGLECCKLSSVLVLAYTTSVLSVLASSALALHLATPLSSATVAMFLHTPALPAISDTPAFHHTADGRPSFEVNCSSGVADGIVDGEEPGDGSRTGLQSEVDKPATYHGRVSGSEPEPPGHQANQSSSLWSLVFLDSLLTQLWSMGSKPTHGTVETPQSCLRKRSRLAEKCSRHQNTQSELSGNHHSEMPESGQFSDPSITGSTTFTTAPAAQHRRHNHVPGHTNWQKTFGRNGVRQDSTRSSDHWCPQGSINSWELDHLDPVWLPSGLITPELLNPVVDVPSGFYTSIPSMVQAT